MVSLGFQLVGEQKKLDAAQKAYTVANDRFEEAMTSNEDLRAQWVKEKEEADLKSAELERDLADECAKAAGLEKESPPGLLPPGCWAWWKMWPSA